ncbi:hypothetical protein Tco_0617394 [Tanacetum coccineum]
MSCSLPHTDLKSKLLVSNKLIDEDIGRQKRDLDLALQFENSTQLSDLRKATRNAAKLEKLKDAKLAWLLDKYYYRSQESLDEALRETLEEKKQAMNAKAREEKIRQKQADDDEFFLTFGRVRIDSDYESSD